MSDHHVIAALRAKEAIKSVGFYLTKPIQIGDKTRAGVRFHGEILVDTLTANEITRLIDELNESLEYTKELWIRDLTNKARELLGSDLEDTP